MGQRVWVLKFTEEAFINGWLQEWSIYQWLAARMVDFPQTPSKNPKLESLASVLHAAS
jgi:hypothetical protein